MDLANLGFGPELQAILEDDASQVMSQPIINVAVFWFISDVD